MRKHPKVNTKLLKALVKRISLGIILILLFSGFSLKAQSISLKVENEPLNRVFVHLRDQYNLNFSFDDKLLSKYNITIQKDFSDPDKAIEYLIKDYSLSVEKIDGVYLIYPISKKPEKVPDKKIVLLGVIKDAHSGETLPYSHLSLNDIGLISDGQGRFTFISRNVSSFNIKATYLGYYTLDTTLTGGGNHTVVMQPSIVGIKEIVVKNKSLKLSTMSKFNPGEMRLNHQVGSYLPGSADNALYNLLRLQPGVLAAGEQSNDLIVWGSYSGQTAVLFDGFTLYGLKNYNDNIGIVNPFMIKDVKLLKGGYPANYGGKAGGIVDITGISGNHSKPEVILSATNMTLNSKLSIPIANRSALSIAFRQTYYNLYRNSGLDFLSGANMPDRRPGKGREQVDLNVSPDYMFRDFTAKYAGVSKSGDRYYLDFLRGIDRFDYQIDFLSKNNREFNNQANESHKQTGSSFYYGKVWDSGVISNLTLSYSELSHQLINQTSTEIMPKHNKMLRYENIQNRIAKFKAITDHKIQINQNNKLEMGGGILNYAISLSEDTIGQNIFSEDNSAFAFEGFIQDRISFKNGLNLIAGFRIDAPMHLKKAMLQPRISLNYSLSPKLWLKAGSGQYNQYVVQSSVLDEAGNYRYFWTLSNNDEVPIQKAQHFTAGLNYEGSFFNLGLEGYYKKLEGLTRYTYRSNGGVKDLSTGDGISRGLDVLLETKYRKHSAWIAYTLSQTLEQFSYFNKDIYLRAPQDQRHEIKLAMLLDFHPFYISSNYVYGSGFPDRSINNQGRVTTDLRYSRWDISGVYRKSLNKLDFHIGLSILNVLNTENIKLQNFIKIPDQAGSTFNIHAEAVPFTPTLFLLVKF